MRIGSFFSVLLVALIALGFFLSDSMHLRETINSQQQEIQRLGIALQKNEQERQNALTAIQAAQQEKQNTLINLQDASKKLQICQEDAARTNQIIAQLTNENTLMKQQIYSPNSASQSMDSKSIPVQQPFQIGQSRAASLIVFAVMSIGSILTLVWKTLHNRLFSKGNADKKGNYIHLSQDEIKELAKRRRAVNETNSTRSDS